MICERPTNNLVTNPHNQIDNSMAKIFQLLQFTDDRPSIRDAQTVSEASGNQRRAERVVVIPFQSPNDQQQVYTVRT